ncbi:MAG TPA: SulP family inorganic anion transporter [Fimbriiglobus sp.]|nr:SulP family inorganic anion transporter [Fimbriiglobus sp.]
MSEHPTAAPGRDGRAWLADLLASLVTFMVALPLCIGIAQACGLPPEAGIVTGVIGGILVGTLSGSPLQVSGPAAGLIVLVIQFLRDAADAGYVGVAGAALLGLAIVLSGVIQVLAGVFRLGQWFRAVSPAVVGGMLAGIGITIIAKQFHVMVDDLPPAGVVAGLATIPQAIWKGFVPPPGSQASHSAAALIGLLTLLVLSFWTLLTKSTRLKFIPAAVVAVILGVLVNEFGRPALEILGIVGGPPVDDHGGLGVKRVAVSANLLDGLAPVASNWPGWEMVFSGLVLKAAVVFALIASAETLLCSTAVDTRHTGPRTNYDKELAAQGVGNMVSGALGALPMTGVIVRSSANVDAGAKTRLSTILHGVWLLLFVSLFPGVLSRIPLAALAAILVYTGWKLVNLPGLARLWKVSRTEALIFAATAIGIVSADLLTGVVLGVVLSAVKLLWMFSHLGIERHDEPDHNRVHLHLEGAGTFLRLPKLAEVLDSVPNGSNLHVHLDQLRLVDHAILTLLMEFQKQHEIKGGRMFLDWDHLKARFHAPRLAGPGTHPTFPPKPTPEAVTAEPQ